ncbi:uncharacterized protein LOC125239437 [Leguminivora glycinivorella]|uniref:uncharacterized protein LOC125239437 n=1 Tax=Leguminivora glycinivorella TaxID=1035111 RepID=UPI00200C39B5|nr:uncharacterized protein LOC125239437 [Leguminivora glycinivorella]
MKKTLILFCLTYIIWPSAADYLLVEEEQSARYMISAAMDCLQHTQIELWKLTLQRQMLRGNAPYEIGFLVRTSEERYRKMVDIYNSSTILDDTVRMRDQILHLQKIEKLHWDVLHLANMLHEVEKKYKIKPQVLDKRVFYPFGATPSTSTESVTTEETTTSEFEEDDSTTTSTTEEP